MQESTFGSILNIGKKMIVKYNIIIIGGGPAGISAGIYAKYDGNNPLIVEKNTLAWLPENHVNLLDKLEGFPGLLNTVNGTELITKFKHSLKEMGVEYYENTKVTNISKQEKGFIVQTNNGTYQTAAIIIATGTVPAKPKGVLGIEICKDFYYFAYSNYKKYKNKKVVVLGSRNSGSTAAIYLAQHGLKVTILEIKDKVQAKEKHTKHFKPLGINLVTGSNTKSLKSDSRGNLTSVLYEKNGKNYELESSAVFCYVGVEPETSLANKLGIRFDKYGYIKTDFHQKSNIQGIFVAGDVCGDLKHIIAASGQGAKAAYNVNKYLMEISTK